MTTLLLDVNVLLASTDPMHIPHEPAHRWFARGSPRSWATCPLTENGFVRVGAHQKYPNRPGDARVVLGILRELCRVTQHEFWCEDISLRDALAPESAITHSQVTDLYLLALAARNGGRLATVGRHIPFDAVPGGPAALEVVPA